MNEEERKTRVQEIVLSVIHDPNSYFEDEIPNVEKWRLVLDALDLNAYDVFAVFNFQEVYEGNDSFRYIEGIMYLADLKCEVFDALDENDIGDPIVNEISSVTNYLWYLRLRDRVYSELPHTEVKHYWLN